MIAGIGIDIVQIKRMERWLDNPKLLERFFHAQEIASIHSFAAGAGKRKRPAEALAARFAAKEAFSKALGTGLAGISIKDIVIANNENGKPFLKLFGTAQKALEESGAGRVHLSLSHEKDYAAAVVILETLPHGEDK